MSRSGPAADLRRAFDASFAAPPPGAPPPSELLLAVRAGGGAYGIRLSEITGVARAGRVTPLPSPRPEWIGAAAVRGGVVPVYGLAAMLGRPPDPDPDWLVLCGKRETLGLAVEAVAGCFQAAAADVGAAPPPGAYTRSVAPNPARVRAVVDIPSILSALRSRDGITA